ncbi:MAG: Ldh family oxidoreductase [Oscillospiraceae bacterium]
MEKQKMRQHYVRKEALTDCCVALLEQVGVPWEEAKVIADGIVLADLRGVGSHGVIRMKQYLQSFLDGGIRKKAQWTIMQESQSGLCMDARGSSGFVIGTKVMEVLIEKASVSGIAMAAVKDSSHFGMAAYYSMMPLQRGMIGIVTCNTAPYMAPWGGSMAFFGTNPISVGIPAGDCLPVVLDMATTVAARGKIVLAEKERRSLPEGWALDNRGVMTTDPKAALDGTLLPAGGPKGYGLALVADILSGLLSGGVYGPHVGSSAQTSVPQGASQCFTVIDIQKFQPLKEFEANMDQMIREIKYSPKADGVDEIYLPGELEFHLTEQRKEEGIPLSEEQYTMLEAFCDRYNIPMPESREEAWNTVMV